MRLHWKTRIAMLLVLMVVLWWQSRYTGSIHNPMYGWPMPFNNVWYRGSFEWRPLVLVLDAAVWTALAASVGAVVERWRQILKTWQFSIIRLLGIQAVAAGILVLGIGEHWLRANPNNGSIIPKYARWEVAGVDVWFDIGLFSDPIHSWPIIRITVILAIGCAIYVGGCTLWSAARRVLYVIMHRKPHHQCRIEHSTTVMLEEPIVVRVVYWLMVACVVLMLLTSLFPPMVR